LPLQVLWSYGRRSNDDFFAYHGFVLQDNPDEDVVLFDGAAALAAWALQQLPELRAALLGTQQQQQLQAVAGEPCDILAQPWGQVHG
jgi:hypothetical protein